MDEIKMCWRIAKIMRDELTEVIDNPRGEFVGVVIRKHYFEGDVRYEVKAIKG